MSIQWPAVLAAAGAARDARAAGAAFTHLTADEARDLEAIAPQLRDDLLLVTPTRFNANPSDPPVFEPGR